LRLRLCPLAELGADSVLEFEVLDAKRGVLERGSAVPAALPVLARVELVIAAPDALLIDARLPRVSGARLRAALPALAEPVLLGELEQAFVVAGKPDGAGHATLAVLDRALFRRALDLLARLEIEPVSATPEPLTLPAGEGRWRLRIAAAYACLRMGERLGLCCSPAQGAEPPVELRLALAQAGAAKPAAIEVEGECDAAAWSAALGVPVIAVPQDAARTAPPVSLPVSFELLQYEFATRIVDWRAWRVPTALAAALVLAWIAALNVDAWRLLREERELRTRMNAVFHEAFPRVPVVLDPLVQMRRGLAELRGGAGTGDPEDFMALAAAFAQAVPAEPGSVRSVEYHERALQVGFEPRLVDSTKKRESLLERLEQAGLSGRFSDATLNVRRRGPT
jgi:general secretion pathway protein L